VCQWDHGRMVKRPDEGKLVTRKENDH
jgi:hypothetical protein